MFKDEIVEEIHRIRRAYSESFNHDLQAMYEDIKRREATSGRTYVTPNFSPESEEKESSVSEV
ncbi:MULTISPECIES: hypothetical protein [Synechocystis]|uniref:Uncharacterized protein n=1 Tax=Synechocystis salina LEGE 00031 TaxID=1828736 RepID=A0ABR9VWV2_9SYNC|nr:MULTISPECIES: hypothetical protein [Synechocystis]MBD2655329.1 hypothetical protein [Synechocystis sp. FACHB-383]MBE9195670.1 hypothetical protein [Synechocystis sp. LEGE 06083]MBE9242156.1 hypothetical protein [Synechocystis salina LEGE 00041]MBE9255348.1 hypothetical protein [Synechocystis salina LEGE 00031]